MKKVAILVSIIFFNCCTYVSNSQNLIDPYRIYDPFVGYDPSDPIVPQYLNSNLLKVYDSQNFN